MKADHPLKRLLAGRCRQALRRHVLVAKKGDPAGVHDLRVATRRLQEILEFLEPVLPSRPRRKLSRRARRIRRSLGPIRNADVMHGLVRSFARRSRPAVRMSLEPLIERLTNEARALREAGMRRGGLKLPELRHRVRKLPARLNPPAGFTIPGRGREMLARRAAEMDEAISAARTGNAAALHALRIAIKRHRYTLEILEESGLRRMRGPIATARALQTRLGKIHDLDVLAQLLRGQKGGSSARALLTRLRSERRDRVADAMKAINRFDPSAAHSIVDAAASRAAAA